MLFQERMSLLKEMEKNKCLLLKNNELEQRFQALDTQSQDFNEFEELNKPLYTTASMVALMRTKKHSYFRVDPVTES